MEVVSNVAVPEGSELEEVLSKTEIESGGSNGGGSKTGSDDFDTGGSDEGESKTATDDCDGGGSTGGDSKSTGSDEPDGGFCNGGRGKTGSDVSDGGGGNGGERKTGSEDSDLELCKGKIRIHVSKNKKPLFFYVNLAKKYIKQYYDVELTALGMAIPTAIIISEFLKRNGLAVEKNISTSTVVGTRNEKTGRTQVKAQICILLGLAEKLEERLVPAESSN